jgi:DNA-binding CsgD family transcriptional regulator
MGEVQIQPNSDGTALPLGEVFERSRIPMALLDRDRRFVKVNDALINFYEYPRAELIGSVADRMVVDGDGGLGGRWEQLVREKRLYGVRLARRASGTQLRVTYAAHVTTIEDRWLALVVTLSARLADGTELIGDAQVESTGANGSKLTPREREIVRLVALGSNTGRIASELYLSPATVRSHVRNAMAKTGAHTRAHLVAMALSDGLGNGKDGAPGA